MNPISPESARMDHETLRALLRLKAAAECATLPALAERVPGTRIELRLALRRLRAAGLLTVDHREAQLTMLGLAIGTALLPPSIAPKRRRQQAA